MPGGDPILVVGHEALAAKPAVRLLDEAGAIVAAPPIEARVDFGVVQDRPSPVRTVAITVGTVADHGDLAVPFEYPELTAAPVFQRAVLLQAGLVGDGLIRRECGKIGFSQTFGSRKTIRPLSSGRSSWPSQCGRRCLAVRGR